MTLSIELFFFQLRLMGSSLIFCFHFVLYVIV